MTAHTPNRVRLRALVSDYHRAAATDGSRFADAADALAQILATTSSRAQIVASIDAAAAASSHDVAELLAAARIRVLGDTVALARAHNDIVNARVCDTDHHKDCA